MLLSYHVAEKAEGGKSCLITFRYAIEMAELSRITSFIFFKYAGKGRCGGVSKLVCYFEYFEAGIAEIAFGVLDPPQIHIFGKTIAGMLPETAAEIVIAHSDIRGNLIHGKFSRQIIFDKT